jgi:hypothetical protein
VTDVLIGLGYPVYVLTILGAFKVPGAIVVVAPGMRRLKEWAYAGIIFELLGAAASNGACHQNTEMIVPLCLAGIALASWALRPPSRILETASGPVALGLGKTSGRSAGLY